MEPPQCPRPGHSPHHNANEEGDAQEQAAPGHQEGIGRCQRAGAGFHHSPCSGEEGQAHCGDGGRGAPSSPQLIQDPSSPPVPPAVSSPKSSGGSVTLRAPSSTGNCKRGQGSTRGWGRPPALVSPCPTQGHGIQPGAHCVPSGTAAVPHLRAEGSHFRGDLPGICEGRGGREPEEAGAEPLAFGPLFPLLPVQGVPAASWLHSLHAPWPNSSCARTCTMCRVPRQASRMSSHVVVTWSTWRARGQHRVGDSLAGAGGHPHAGEEGSHLGEGLGRLRAVADLEAEPVEAVVPGRGVRPVDPQPLWCLLQCLHRHVERGVGLHCWGSRGRRGLAPRCSAAAAPGKRGAALTDAAEGDDSVLAGRAASAVADACGYHKGFGVIGARGHLQPADKLSRLGEVAAPLLCGIPSCEPAATWLSWGCGTRQAQGSPVWHGAKGTTKSRAGGVPALGRRQDGAHLRFTQSIARVPGDGFARSGHSHRTSLSWLRR